MQVPSMKEGLIPRCSMTDSGHMALEVEQVAMPSMSASVRPASAMASLEALMARSISVLPGASPDP